MPIASVGTARTASQLRVFIVTPATPEEKTKRVALKDPLDPPEDEALPGVEACLAIRFFTVDDIESREEAPVGAGAVSLSRSLILFVCSSVG